MVLRNLRARLGVVARRAGQRLDEAGQRRERRAQLVAGIGDEVRAHAFDHQLLGELAQSDQRRGARAQPDRHDLDPERARRRSRQVQVELGRAVPLQRLVDRGEDAGIAQAGLEQLADRIVTEQPRRSGIRARDDAAVVDHQERIGQGVQQRPQPAVRLRAPCPLLGQRPIETVQHRRQLVAAKRPELRQGRRLATFGERGQITAGLLEPALPTPREHAAEDQAEHPREQRRPDRQVVEHREDQERDRDRQRQPDRAHQQPARRHLGRPPSGRGFRS